MLDEISKRYAGALFDAVSPGQTEKILHQIRQVGQLLDHKEMREILKAPTLSKEEKQGIVEKMTANMNLEPLVENFLKIIVSKGRAGHLPGIVLAFEKRSDEKNQVVRGFVYSASPLSEEEKVKIEKAIQGKIKKQPLLEYREEKGLLGGVVAHVGSHTFDGSLRTQLSGIENNLFKNL